MSKLRIAIKSRRVQQAGAPAAGPGAFARPNRSRKGLVRASGIEPLTPTMSR
jgi:hypothetical protein